MNAQHNRSPIRFDQWLTVHPHAGVERFDIRFIVHLSQGGFFRMESRHVGLLHLREDKRPLAIVQLCRVRPADHLAMHIP